MPVGSANQATSSESSAAGDLLAQSDGTAAIVLEPLARGPAAPPRASWADRDLLEPLLKASPRFRRVHAVIAKRLDGVLRVTGVGAGSLFLTLLIYAAAVNTGTNLLYLMLSALLSLWTLTLVIQWVNLLKVTARRAAPGDIYAGRPVEIRYEATNGRRRFTTFGVAALDRFEGAEPARLEPFFLAIGPGKTAHASVRATFGRRGWVELPDLMLVSSFPFGFVEARSRCAAASRALVFPELLPLEAAARQFAASRGQRESTRRGTGAGLYSIRNYVWGDSARSIHWKLSAKGAGVKVREFESEDTRRFRLVFDVAPPARPDPRALKEFELAVSAAASLARGFFDDGFPIALWTPGETVPVGQGATHYRRVLTALALLEWRDCVGASRPPSAAPGAEVTDVSISQWLPRARVIREAADRAAAGPSALA